MKVNFLLILVVLMYLQITVMAGKNQKKPKIPGKELLGKSNFENWKSFLKFKN